MMARKVIIDCDMGTDDAVALCMALFDERLDVLGVTATEGCVTADQATRNLQAIIGVLDPPRYPRLGAASPCEEAPAINTTFLYGDDGLGNQGFEVSGLQHMQPSWKLIHDLIRANPGSVTIIGLGPYTNIARAFQRDPAICEQVDRLILAGGSICGPGNITAAAEFNCFFDPPSANSVFMSRTTKSLLPLDITSRVHFEIGFIEKLPERFTRVGGFLRQVLPYVYRTYHNRLGTEHIVLNDAVALLAAIEPDLFEFRPMACQVETQGHLTRGVTVFDRRSVPEWNNNMEVAVDIREEAVVPVIARMLDAAGQLT